MFNKSSNKVCSSLLRFFSIFCLLNSVLALKCEWVDDEYVCDYSTIDTDKNWGLIIGLTIAGLIILIALPIGLCFCCACACFAYRKKEVAQPMQTIIYPPNQYPQGNPNGGQYAYPNQAYYSHSSDPNTNINPGNQQGNPPYPTPQPHYPTDQKMPNPV